MDAGAATAPMAPPAPAGVAVRPLDFTIVVPNLRNGAAEDIQQAAPKASISSAYKWVAITDATAAHAVVLTEYYIRGTFAQLMSAAGANATDAMRSAARRKAIILGAVRVGAMAAWNLTRADLNTAECTSSGYVYDPVSGRVSASVNGGTAGGKYTVGQSMADLDRDEVEVVSVMVYLGMAVPVLQGVSLVGTGHHYLPTTKNVFAGTLRQAMGLAHEATRQFVEGMGETFEDMAFHKACHPISPPLKRRLAKDPQAPGRMMASGHGAASIRLPAMPSDAAVGKTAVALGNAARPVVESMGHTIQLTVGPDLIRTLEMAPEGREERDAVEAIRAWAAAHMDTLAFCAGIVADVHDRVGTKKNTLLSAYSVKKLMGDYPSAVDRGRAYARSAHSRMKDAMDSGVFPDPDIRM